MKKPTGRNVLGRGLEALIPTAPPQPAPSTAPLSAGGASEIDIDRIHPNSYQPRDHFDPEALAELAQSIKENGILQPIVVRPHREDYQIVAGERRWRAAQLAGLKRVPAVVKSVADSKMLELALVENIQRRDLTVLETSKAFRLLIDEHRLTQEDLATRVGMKRSSVANYLRLLSLADPVKEALEASRIEMGHARAIGGLEAPGDQVHALQAIVKGFLSVRQAEDLVQRMKAGKVVSPTAPARKDPNIVSAEKRLQRALGTRVNIVLRPKGTGRIEILFKSEAELQRIYTVLSEDQTAGADIP